MALLKDAKTTEHAEQTAAISLLFLIGYQICLYHQVNQNFYIQKLDLKMAEKIIF